MLAKNNLLFLEHLFLECPIFVSSETGGIFFREHEMSGLFIFGHGGGSGPVAGQRLCQPFKPSVAVGRGGLRSSLRVQPHLEGVKGFVSQFES